MWTPVRHSWMFLLTAGVPSGPKSIGWRACLNKARSCNSRTGLDLCFTARKSGCAVVQMCCCTDVLLALRQPFGTTFSDESHAGSVVAWVDLLTQGSDVQ